MTTPNTGFEPEDAMIDDAHTELKRLNRILKAIRVAIESPYHDAARRLITVSDILGNDGRTAAGPASPSPTGDGKGTSAQLKAIAWQIQRWIDWDKAERSKELLDTNRDTAIMSLPVPFWPSHGQFAAWIETFNAAIAALRQPPQPVEAPGHTDLMVSPEAIDKFLDENPPPADVSDDLIERRDYSMLAKELEGWADWSETKHGQETLASVEMANAGDLATPLREAATAISTLQERVKEAERYGRERTELAEAQRRRAETAEQEAVALRGQVDEVKAALKETSDALLKVRPLGGSELFKRYYFGGEEVFFADPHWCGEEIERLRSRSLPLPGKPK